MRLVGALSLAAAVSACAGGDSLGTGTTFSQASSKDALVVMGVRMSRTYAINYKVQWIPFNRETGDYSNDGRPVINAGLSGFRVIAEKGYSAAKYVVFRAKPGAYLLRSSTATAGRNVFTTIYRPRTLSFDVAKSEILYIGDYVFAVSVRSKSVTSVRMRYAGRSDERAKQALSQYSKVTGQMVYFKPLPVDTP